MNLTDLVIPPWVKIAAPIALALAIITGFHFYMVHEREKARTEQYAADKVVLDQMTASVRTATAAALAADQKAADAKKASYEQAKKESDDAYQLQLADYRGRLAAYVGLHPASSGPGQGGGDVQNMPGSSNAPNGADGANQYAVVPVDDLENCTDAVTRLQNVQAWWNSIEGLPQ